jgi:hypothetical protein
MDNEILIPHIYHFFNIEKDFEMKYYHYFSLKSLLEINDSINIYYYYYYLPKGTFWDKLIENNENLENNDKFLNNKIVLKKINIPVQYTNIDEYLKKNIQSIIYFNLYNYGGILCNLNMCFTKKLDDLLSKYEYVFDAGKNIIMCAVNSPIIKKYMENLLKTNKEDWLISNYTDKYICIYSNEYYELENNGDFFFKNIIDYCFTDYFHIIKNCYYVIYKNCDLDNYDLKYILDNNTTYSFIVKYILSYKYMYNNIDSNNSDSNNLLTYNNSYSDKLTFINNIDVLLWINLERCDKRRCRMSNEVLNKFDVMNYRFSAFDGKYIEDIKNKYFISIDNTYPNYTNAEYATLLSHLNCIELYCNTFNNCKYNYGLICEDDLSLEFVKYWKVDLKSIIEELKDFDILMLGYFSLSINHPEKFNKWTGNQWSCMAYIVNKKTVSEKIKDLKIDGKWKCNKYDLMIADNYIYSKFNTYYYKYPYFCNPTINDSNIHEDHLDYHIMYKNMNYLTLNEVYL